MSKPILVFGTVVIDRVRRIDKFPKPGGYAEFHDEQWFLGGEAANTAVALRKWGAEVVLLGNSLGESTESEWLKEQLRGYGVDPSHCESGTGPAPTCDIYVTPDGCRTMFGTGWPNGDVELPDVAAEWLTVDPNRLFKAHRAIQEAHRRGQRVYAMDILAHGVGLTDGDFCQLSARTVRSTDTDSPLQLAEGLSKESPSTVILTQGEGPVIWAKEGRTALVPTFQSGVVVDTTGAGDCFRAGMLFGLNQGWDQADCVVFASAAASLKCESLGATSGIPGLQEVEGRLNEQPKVVQTAMAALQE